MSQRVCLSLRIILPALWLGLIVAIDLIEAPLKFQAPGITIPLGLGIGRLVFLAMNVTEVAIAVVLGVVLWRSRADRYSWLRFSLAALLLAVKVLVIRPILAQYTNAVIAGTQTGGSFAHYLYIAADILLFVLLVWFLIAQCRRIITVSENNVVGSR